MPPVVYGCELVRAREGRPGKFKSILTFSYELDLDEGEAHNLKAALVTGVRQSGGDESDIDQYRLNIYDNNGVVKIAGFSMSNSDLSGYTTAVHLSDITDEQLVNELLKRLRNR